MKLTPCLLLSRFVLFFQCVEPEQGLPLLLKPEATAFGSQCPERFSRGEAKSEARRTPLLGIDTEV